MSRRVDQIQNICFPILGTIGQGYGVAFDGDAAFPFYIHIVQHLILKISFIADTGKLDQPVGQSGLAVIDMGNNTKIPNIFHKGVKKSPPKVRRAFIFNLSFLLNSVSL